MSQYPPSSAGTSDLEERIRRTSHELHESLKHYKENPYPAHLTKLRMEKDELIKKINGKYLYFSFFQSKEERRTAFREYVDDMTETYNAKVSQGLENLSYTYDRPLKLLREIRRDISQARKKKRGVYSDPNLSFEDILGYPLKKRTVDDLEKMNEELGIKLQNKYFTQREKERLVDDFDENRNHALFGILAQGYRNSSPLGKAGAIAAGISIAAIMSFNVHMLGGIIEYYDKAYEENYITLERVRSPLANTNYQELTSSLQSISLDLEQNRMAQERFRLEDITQDSTIEPIRTQDPEIGDVGTLDELRRYLRSAEVQENPERGIDALESLVQDTVNDINAGRISVDHLAIDDEKEFWSLFRVPDFYPDEITSQLNSLQSTFSYNAMYASLPFINIFSEDSVEHGLTDLQNYMLFPIFITTQESSKGNRFAVSHAAAAGPFQIMPETGRNLGLSIDPTYERYVEYGVKSLGYRNAKAVIYGLSRVAQDTNESLFSVARRVNTYDERVDPVKAAHASMALHGENHQRFETPEKMIASYNGGGVAASNYTRYGLSGVNDETRKYILSYYNVMQHLTSQENLPVVQELLNMSDATYDNLLDRYQDYYDSFFMDLVSAYDFNYGEFNGSLNRMFQNYYQEFDDVKTAIEHTRDTRNEYREVLALGNELIERMQYYFHLE
jgi:hypothetical protein